MKTQNAISLLVALILFASVPCRGAETPESKPTPHKSKPPKETKQPNLVKNGDFESGFAKDEKGKTDAKHPLHWRVFDKPGIELVRVGPPHKHVLRLEVDRRTARSPGLRYQSEPIPATPGKTYDVSMDIRSSGIGVIIWVKGYAVLKGGTFSGRPREIYNHKKEARLPKKNEWTRFESYFTPREPAGAAVRKRRGVATPSVEHLRVQLYAYGGSAGVAEFDNVRLTERTPSEKKPSVGARETP